MAIFRKKGRRPPNKLPQIAKGSSSDDADDEPLSSGTTSSSDGEESSSDSSPSAGEESSSDESSKEGSNNSSSSLSSTSNDVEISDQDSIRESIPTFEDSDSGDEPPQKRRRASRTKNNEQQAICGRKVNFGKQFYNPDRCLRHQRNKKWLEFFEDSP